MPNEYFIVVPAGSMPNESTGDKKRKKTKKWKHEHDLSTENLDEAHECEKEELNTSMKETKSDHIPASNSSVVADMSSGCKKTKKRKQKHELSTETMSKKTKSNLDELHVDMSLKDLLPGGADIAEETCSRKKKKSKKRKHSLSADELDETPKCDKLKDGNTSEKQKTENFDTPECTGVDSGVAEESSIPKKKKSKKQKHELSAEKPDEKADRDELKDGNTPEKQKSESVDTPECGGDDLGVVDESSIGKKKKSKKQKHELTTEKLDEKAECVELKDSNTSEKKKTENVDTPDCPVEDSGAAEESSIRKKKKSKKQKHELKAEKFDEKAEFDELKDGSTSENQKTENVGIPACRVQDSGIGEETSIRKKKKSKKHKEELSAEKLDEKLECDELKDGNTFEKQKTENVDIPECGGEDSRVAEESGILEKKKSKKRKHELSPENLDEKAERGKLKDGNTSEKHKTESVDTPECGGEDTGGAEESTMRKKKKSKKQFLRDDVGEELRAHEKLNEHDLTIEKVSKKPEQDLKVSNTSGEDVTDSDVPSCSTGVQEESHGDMKQKTMKHKHELLTGNLNPSLEENLEPETTKELNTDVNNAAAMKGEMECEMKGNNTTEGRQTSGAVTDLIANVAVELTVARKGKKSKKGKREERLSSQKTADELDCEEQDVNNSLQDENRAVIKIACESKGDSDKKRMKGSDGDSEDVSNVDMTKKKSKKRKEEQELSTDEMDQTNQEEKITNTTEKLKVTAKGSASESGVAEDSSDKTENSVHNLSTEKLDVKTEEASSVVESYSCVEDAPCGHKKRKKSKKRKHENDISNGELDPNTQWKTSEISTPLKEEATSDIKASSADVKEACSDRKKKKKKKSKKQERENELSKDEMKEEPDKSDHGENLFSHFDVLFY